MNGATGRPYPRGYRVADPGWLQLAPVTVTTYRDETDTVHLLVVRENPSTATGSP